MNDLTQEALDAWCARLDLPVPIRFVAETGSTNTDLKALAAAGAPHGTAIVAAAQTEGRGRLGRKWESADGNLYVSVLSRPAQLGIASVPLVSLGAAVAAAGACGPAYQIKWPNDVLHPSGVKVAGILCEAESQGMWVDWIVVGVGINVRSVPEGLPGAGALEALDGRDRDRAETTALLVRDLLREIDTIATAPGDMFERWRERDCTLGRQVTVGNVSGEAVGIDPNGALQVQDALGRVHRVYAGDLHYAQGSGMPSLLERLTREAMERARVEQAEALARVVAATPPDAPPTPAVEPPPAKARKPRAPRAKKS